MSLTAKLVRWSSRSGMCVRMAATTLVVAGSAAIAMGQASPTAIRTAHISVYGEASRINNDYTPDQSYGYIIGGDFTRSFHRIEVSLDPSYGWHSDYLITQKYFLANLKLGKAFGPGERFHPYAMGGIGRGSMHFGHPLLTSESSTVYDLAGGLDYDVSYLFGVKAQYSYQFWDFGYYSDGLNPRGFSAGLVYHINSLPFHRHRR